MRIWGMIIAELRVTGLKLPVGEHLRAVADGRFRC